VGLQRAGYVALRRLGNLGAADDEEVDVEDLEFMLKIIASRAAILLDHPELNQIPWWTEPHDKELHRYHLLENLKSLCPSSVKTA